MDQTSDQLKADIERTRDEMGDTVEALAYKADVPTRTKEWLGDKKEVWLHFAAWLVIGLEFELAADVLRTAISPSWDDIGQLASIAVIRTFLNYFLGKDIEKFRATEAEKAIA